MSLIHPTAVIDPRAKIAKNVVIGPYCVIGQNVVLEEAVELKSHVVIDGYTTIGARTVVYPSAVIGTKTQDKKYRGEKTYVLIGSDCEIREFVTINSSCGEGTAVKVGNGCLIMAYCHIAHNCELGNNVIMANNATLAGHVIVGNSAIIGGLAAVHQFVRIGDYAMIGGMSRITHDVPPFTIGAGSPYRYGGLNLVGLKRHGFSLSTRSALSKAFKITCRSGLTLAEAIDRIENDVEALPEVKNWVDFCKSSQRGLMASAVKESSSSEE